MTTVPPSKTFTPGLDFSSRAYGDTSEERFVRHSAQAYEIVKSKLPILGELGALVQLVLGDSNNSKAPVFVDARTDKAVLLNDLPEGAEPDVKITINPDYIIQFSEGNLDTRLGMFKDAIFHEPSMPKGNIPKAVRFADLLTPHPPRPLKTADSFDPDKLPKPTEDLDQVKKDIQDFGYGLVQNALSAQEVATLKKALQEQAAGERKAGVASFDGGPQTPNQRIWNIINKGPEFVDLLNHPLIDEVIPWFLGDHAIMYSYTANIARPGNVPMQLHTDQLAITPPRRGMAYGLNIVFYLEDTSEELGATRVYPASHHGNVAPTNIFSVDGSIAAEGPAGTALVFETRLWHATGANRAFASKTERPVILLLFMRSFVRPQENAYLTLRKDVEETLPERQKAFLGFRSAPGIGGLEGNVVEGVYVSRRDDAVGILRAPHQEVVVGT